MSEQQQVYWNPDAQVNISGAEFGAFSQILDLVVAPLGSYSLGDMMTLVAMAQEARGQVIKRLQEANQIFSHPVVDQSPVEDPSVESFDESTQDESVSTSYPEPIQEEILQTEEATQEFGVVDTLTEKVQDANHFNKIDENEKGFLI